MCPFVFIKKLVIFAAAIALPAAALHAQTAPQTISQKLENAVPESRIPSVDGMGKVPGYTPEQVSNLIITLYSNSSELMATQGPQSRVLPAKADNMREVTSPAIAEKNSLALSPYSPNWLLAGVNQLEVEQKKQRGKSSSIARDGAGIATEETLTSGNYRAQDRVINDEENARTETAPTAPNPLLAYLQKWASSRESSGVQNATLPAIESIAYTAANDSLMSQQNSAPRPPPNTPAALMVSVSELTHAMLDSTGPNVVRPPPRPFELPSTASPADQNYNSPLAPFAPAIDTSRLTVKPIAPEPIKPIVNDKKYFPQLQRF